MQIAGDQALLSKNGVTLKLRVISPAISTIYTTTVAIESGQNATMLYFNSVSSGSPQRFAVVLQGGGLINNTSDITLLPLNELAN